MFLPFSLNPSYLFHSDHTQVVFCSWRQTTFSEEVWRHDQGAPAGWFTGVSVRKLGFSETYCLTVWSVDGEVPSKQRFIYYPCQSEG